MVSSTLIESSASIIKMYYRIDCQFKIPPSAEFKYHAC
jgi:hypothetical protein